MSNDIQPIIKGILNTKSNSVMLYYTYFYILISRKSINDELLVTERILNNEKGYLDNFYITRQYRSPFLFYFLGKSYNITYTKNSYSIDFKTEVITNDYYSYSDLEHGLYYIYLKKINEWYKKIEEYINKKIGIIGVAKILIEYKASKSYLGKCIYNLETNIHRIIINPYIMKYSEEVVKYVYFHEYCHVIHHNHKIGFSQTLSILVPNLSEVEYEIHKNKFYSHCVIEEIDYNYLKENL
jgi:predicted metal-dependent hydrolase